MMGNMSVDFMDTASSALLNASMTDLPYNATAAAATNSCVAPNLIQLLDEYKPAVKQMSTYMPPLWWAVGIVGNIIALVVWLQPKMRHSSGYYLAALAISDCLFLLLNIVFEINFTYAKAMLDKPALCEWFAISYMSLQHISPVLVLAFTVERYLSVCHPFRTVKLNRMGSSKSTILNILGLGLLCLGINAAHGYFWTTNHGNRDECDIRAVVLSSGVWTYYTWATELLVFALVPLTVLVLNILVIIEVSNISKLERRNMRTNNIDRRSTTLMLLGVSFYQIFTVLPVTTVYALYDQYKPANFECLPADIGSNGEWQLYLQYHSVRVAIEKIGMSHYAANFFIYLLTGKIFRKQLHEIVVLFCCKSRLRYLTAATLNTRTTRLSFTSNRGSIAKGRFAASKPTTDPCNNDTELGNKNSLYSMADLETMDAAAVNGERSHYHSLKSQTNGAQARLLPCVEESDMADSVSDRDNSDTTNLRGH